MPADKQRALAALDEAFSDAVKSAAGTLYASRAGKSEGEVFERQHAETAITLAIEVHDEMVAICNRLLPE